MVMEFIEGARIDDLQFLADHSIDRNQVSKQLSHIMSRMIYITGEHGVCLKLQGNDTDFHSRRLLPRRLARRQPAHSTFATQLTVTVQL